jgi:DNA-binding transcriptional LysR family regulator
MDSLENYKILLSVVDNGGFSLAARAMGLTVAKVSRAVAEIEQDIGVRLLERTTRSVAVTEAGDRFLAQLRPAMEQLANARLMLGTGNKPPVFNSLRLSCCRAGGQALVAPAVASFLANQPQLSLTIDLHDRPVSPESEGYDLALAIGADPNGTGTQGSSVVSIELALVAAPSYVATHKRPQSPDELLQHRLLFWSGMPRWDMRNGIQIVPSSSYFSNDLSIIRLCCIAACGVALLPVFLIADALRERALVQLLDGFEPRPLALFAEWGRRPFPNTAAATFLKHLRQHLKSHST